MLYRKKISLFGALILLVSCSNQEGDTIKGAIAFTLGTDTTMVQKFSLQNNELTQTWIQRSPEVQIVTGKMVLNEEGSILSLNASYFKPDINGERTFLYSGEIIYKNDSTYVSYSDEPEVKAIPGYVMTTNLMKPIGMFWHAQMAYYAPSTIGETKINKHVVFQSPLDFRLSRTSENEVTVGSDAMGRYRILLDASGKVTEVDGTASSFNIRGQVVNKIDMEVLAQRFQKYEIANGKLGSLTGKGEEIGAVNGTNITIQYGRPFRRGRKIFGGIVPWDKVWRTGANAATKMTLDGPLTIGRYTFQIGEYSIWSIPHADGSFDIIINSQANVWGTNHNPSYDLQIIPMKVQQTDDSIEQFTFSVANNELKLSWANTIATVELK